MLDIEVVKTRNECQLTAYLLPLSNVATELLFQSSFSLCRLTRNTRWLWCGLDEQSSATRNVTRHELRLSAYPDSRLYQAMTRVLRACHP